jgi:hypothetical protein
MLPYSSFRGGSAVSELEAIISRYLDGELSPAELVKLRRELASNPDALAVYREMTAIRRAARRAPTLRRPSASTEHHLFQRLHREGLHALPTPAEQTVGRVTAESELSGRRRYVAVAASFLLIALVGIASLLSLRPDGMSSTPTAATITNAPASAPVASGIAPQTTPNTSSIPSAAASALGRRAGRSVSARAAVRRHSNDAALASNATHSPAVILDPVDTATPPSVYRDTTTPRSNPFAAVDTKSMEPPSVPAMLPVPSTSAHREPLLTAGIRFGASYIDRESETAAEELIAGLDVNLGDGHRIAFLGGRSAAVTEQRTENTHAVPARTAVAGGKGSDEGLLQVNESPAPHDVEIQKEWWAGVGYNYTWRVSNIVEIGAGVRGGVGARSLRAGAEGTLRLKATERIAIELIPSATHVVPHTQARSEYSIESASDGYLYEATSENTSFSTYGLSVGIRIALD